MTATTPLSFPTRGCSPRSSLQAEHTHARVRSARQGRFRRSPPAGQRPTCGASLSPRAFARNDPGALSGPPDHAHSPAIDGMNCISLSRPADGGRKECRVVSPPTGENSYMPSIGAECVATGKELRLFGCHGPAGLRSWSGESGHPLRLAARSAPLALSPPTNGWEEGVSCRDVPSAGIEGRWTVPPTFEGVPRSLAPVIPDRRHAFQASLSCRQTGEEGVSCRVVRPPAMHARWCRRSGVTESFLKLSSLPSFHLR